MKTAPIVPPAFLAACAAYQPGTLAIALNRILKATIRTPMKDGRVDYDSVPVGASIWVTVTDSSSPLHGRPILITKRPDHKFALTGGAGWQHYKDHVVGDKGNDDIGKQRARKHLVLEGVGKKPETEEQKAKAGELAEKRKKIAEAQRERRQNRNAAANGLLQAAGIDITNQTSDREFEKLRERTEKEAAAAGMNKQQARQFVGLAIAEGKKLRDRLQLQRAEVKALAAAHALQHHRDSLDEQHVALLDRLPDPDVMHDRPVIGVDELRHLIDEGATPVAIEHAIKQAANDTWADLHEEAYEQARQAEPTPTPGPVQDWSEHGADGDWDDTALTAPPAQHPASPDHAPHAHQPGAGADTPTTDATGDNTPQPVAPSFDDSAESDVDEADEEEEDEDPDIEPEPDELDELDEPEQPQEPEPEPDDPGRDGRIEEIKQLASAFAAYQQAHQTVKTESESALKMRRELFLDSATVENLRQNLSAAGLTDETLDLLISKYNEPHRAHPPDALYEALGDHWNDQLSYASGIGHYAASGAAAAFTGLLGKHLGGTVDVARLIDASSIEAAATAMAYRLRDELSPADYDRALDEITRHNATNQQRTEERALQLHKRLQVERKEIQRQRETGELEGKGDQVAELLDRMSSGDLDAKAVEKYATSIRLEADNLLRQRENLGTALGSLQASAAIVEAMTRAKRTAKKKDFAVRLSFGDNQEAAVEQLHALGLGGRGKPGYDLQRGYYIEVPAQALRRQMTVTKQQTDFAAEMEQIKTDSSSTAGYSVPFWRDRWKDADGNEGAYEWRTEQRNDIEWLKRTGGGVITRVTGAGKTNTALGFFGHKLAENKNYTAAIVVPKGKSSEWHDEAQKFSTLPTIPIPDDAKRPEVARIIQSAGRGKLFVMSHDQAARFADLLEDADLDGLALDEPHMLTGRGKSKKMSTGAQRIMRLGNEKRRTGGDFHRIAMTATPAKNDPVNAYDLVNWVAPGRVGSRARFQRAYTGGFGAGTNAQEEAIYKQVLQQLGPYMSGERLTTPSFKTFHHETTVTRSAPQIERQREIERAAKATIEQRVAERLRRAANDPLLIQKYGRAWRAKVAADETAKAQADIALQHRANLHGGENNPKIEAAIQKIKSAGADKDTKHVFFVDSAEQRQSLVEALKREGFRPNQIANMAASTTSISGEQLSQRREKFKKDADVPFVIIDKITAAGHNLQEGSHLHVLGTPTDAATYLQAQGRIKRDPRKSDAHIHTYKYNDSPFEASDWANLERQLKILQATAPGLTGGM